MTTVDATSTLDRPTTVEGWYRLSDHPRRFLSAVPDLGVSALVRLTERAIAQPPRGRLRSKAELADLGRVSLPALTDFRDRLPTEQTLQWMFMHRGFLVEQHEQIVWRELPTCCSGERAYGRADLLAFDRKSNQPIIVELKRATATDPLSRCVLEVLWHWTFNVQHLAGFNAVLSELDCHCDALPRAVIAAPRSYFAATELRTRGPRKSEYQTAFDWMDGLRRAGIVSTEVYAIADDWLETGPAFGMERVQGA